MVVKTKVKQNNKKTMNNQKKIRIIGLSFSIVLLLLLFGTLALNNYIKSDSRKLMSQFEETISSNESKVIFYYDSSNENLIKENYELGYIISLSKEYNFEYLKVDRNLLSDISKEEIEDTLDIKGDKLAIVIVKNNKVIGTHEGYIESHRLVEFFIDNGLLKKGSKYSEIDNLKIISYSDYLNKIEESDKQIIVIGQSACEYCIKAKPILNNISKAYKVDIYYLDLTELNNVELKEFVNDLPKLGYDDEDFIENESFSLPTILLFEDKEIINYYKGIGKLHEYVKFLKEDKFIE